MTIGDDLDDAAIDQILSRYNMMANKSNFLKMINPTNAFISGDNGGDTWFNMFGKGTADQKEQILEVAGELALKFLCYDRMEDEDLTEDNIMSAIESGKVTVEEIIEAFRNSLLDCLPDED